MQWTKQADLHTAETKNRFYIISPNAIGSFGQKVAMLNRHINNASMTFLGQREFPTVNDAKKGVRS